MEILLHRLGGETQNALDIGADVFRLAGFGVDHQEHVVHIAGKVREQLLACQQLLVLFPQLLPVALHHQQQSGNSQHTRYTAHHGHGGVLQPVHVGVHNAFGSNAKNRPVLEGGRTINHVIADAIDGKLKVAALPGSKRILQGIDLFCRKTSRVFEQGKDIVHTAHVRAAAVQYHTAIRQHRKGALQRQRSSGSPPDPCCYR